MSQIAKLKGTIVLLLGLILMIAGCSDGNSKNSVDPDTGKHYIAGLVERRFPRRMGKAAQLRRRLCELPGMPRQRFLGRDLANSLFRLPWRERAPSQDWTSGTRTHSSTDESNAAVCALCHTERRELSCSRQPGSARHAAGLL